MKKRSACAAVLAVLAFCLLTGCTTDSQTADSSDPYHLDQSATVAHGEATVQYGHSAGH